MKQALHTLFSIQLLLLFTSNTHINEHSIKIKENNFTGFIISWESVGERESEEIKREWEQNRRENFEKK